MQNTALLSTASNAASLFASFAKSPKPVLSIKCLNAFFTRGAGDTTTVPSLKTDRNQMKKCLWQQASITGESPWQLALWPELRRSGIRVPSPHSTNHTQTHLGGSALMDAALLSISLLSSHTAARPTPLPLPWLHLQPLLGIGIPCRASLPLPTKLFTLSSPCPAMLFFFNVLLHPNCLYTF